MLPPLTPTTHARHSLSPPIFSQNKYNSFQQDYQICYYFISFPISCLYVWVVDDEALDYNIKCEYMDSVLIYDIQSEVASECGEELEKGVSEIKKEEKETEISDVSQTKLIKISPGFSNKEEHPPQEHDNIIFYEDDLTKSNRSIYEDETNRRLLKSQLQVSDEENTSEEEYELEERDVVEEMTEGRERAIIPQQVRLKNQTVVVRANADLFIKQVVPATYCVNCIITLERNLVGMANYYRLFLKQPQQFLLSAKKEVFKLYSNFLISRHPSQIHKRSSIYQGRLQGNFVGTQYHLFGSKDQVESLKLTLTYQKNIIGFNGPRTFAATKLNPSVKPTFKNSLQGVLQRNEKSKLIELETAKPMLKKGKFRMDFGGKVKLPSAKNFILEATLPQGRRRCLLFGKRAQDEYVMQVEYPLTIFQAFGICLTSLDSKLMVN